MSEWVDKWMDFLLYYLYHWLRIVFLNVNNSHIVNIHEISPRTHWVKLVQQDTRWVGGRGLMAWLWGLVGAACQSAQWEVSWLGVLGVDSNGGVLEWGKVLAWEQKPKRYPRPEEEVIRKLGPIREPRLLGEATRSWS